jgi:DNA-binding transcriptional LysR family regulator
MSHFDLNLAPVFEALLRCRSVSAAAAELHLTQPAVSNALRRMRTLTGDELFVRTRRGMDPTPFALAAGASLSQGLRLIRAGFERSQPFDPSSAARTFRLLMTDAGEMVFLPRLMPRLREMAPQVRIKVMQLPIARYLEVLETDQADLAIGNLRMTRGAIATRRVFEDTYLAVCRREHPLARTAERATARLAELLAADHVVVRPPNVPDSPLERAFRLNGWKRDVALEVPHYLVLARILADTDLVAITPSLVAREIVRNEQLASLQLPFELPPVVIRLGWHERQRRDGGGIWLRGQIVELLGRSSQKQAPRA